MLKRIICLITILLFVQIPIFAESNRWVPINGDKLHASRFVDNKTIEYDPENKTITYWDKFTAPIIANPKKNIYNNHVKDVDNQNTEILGDTNLSKYTINLDKLDFYMIRTVYYLNGVKRIDLDTTEPLGLTKKPEELSNVEKLFGNLGDKKCNGYFLGYGVIDDYYEHELKYVCDYLGIPTMLKYKPHNWKLIYEKQVKFPVKNRDTGKESFIIDNYKHYICSDLYARNYENGIAKFYIKTVQSFDQNSAHNFVDITNAYVNFKKHRVWFNFGPCNSIFIKLHEKANTGYSGEIVPDSFEEAVYNEALNILSKA